MKYKITILRPSGNNTALVKGLQNKKERKIINDVLMSLYSNIEQVGFYDFNQITKLATLEMAGGEFCGNATRGAAWKILNGSPGEIQIQTSGAKQKLRAGITSDGEAFTQMPVRNSLSSVTPDGTGYLVKLDGITHFVEFGIDAINNLSPEEIKFRALQIMKEKKLISLAAAGVIFVKKDQNSLGIEPIVYVKAIDSLLYETACGSGTTALGIILALQRGSSITEVPIRQPSGMNIKVSIQFDGKKFGYSQIQGNITQLQRGASKLLEGVI